MVVYVEEEEVWKCPTHPSKRRRSGICPACLRDRLGSLCADCHHARPCPCVAASAGSSSSSSSSSFGPISTLIDGEPSFRRSRSVAVPFLRHRNADRTPDSGRSKTPSFLSLLTRSKTKRATERSKEKEKSEAGAVNGGGGGDENIDSNERIEDFVRMVSRSRSVSAGTKSAMASGFFRRADVGSSPVKGKFWNFPSPMKAFRSSKTPKIVAQDRPPLHGG